jgi:hypothetical protein
MLRRLAPFALLVLMGTATAAGQPAASPDTVAAELTLAVRARLDAYARADAAAWGRFVADDCLCGVAGKAGLMQELTTRPAGVHISVGEVGPLEIRMHGDVVVARFRATELTRIGDQQAAVPLMKVETYVRREGRWLLLGGAETVLPIDPPRADVDPAHYDALVGRYEYAPGVGETITRDGVTLTITSTGQPPERLLPESATTFFLAGQPWRYEFVVEGHRATALRFRMYGRELVARRVPDVPRHPDR